MNTDAHIRNYSLLELTYREARQWSDMFSTGRKAADAYRSAEQCARILGSHEARFGLDEARLVDLDNQMKRYAAEAQALASDLPEDAHYS